MSPKALPTRNLGKNGPTVSAIALGAMGMGDLYGQSDNDESFATLTYAADRGMTFWETADIYGTSEVLLGKWFSQTGRRSEIFLATKFGARNLEEGTEFSKPNSKPSYIRNQFHKSLTKLHTEYIDLYYQHRVDPEVPIEVVLETLRPFVESGQLRWIGLTEPSIATLKRARAVKGIGEKVIAAQMEFNPFELYVEKTGFIDAINEAGIGIVAYSPLARGLVTGRFRSPDDFEETDFRRLAPRFSKENFPKNLRVIEELQRIGKKHDATTSQITLAWIIAEHPNIVPVPGIRNVMRLEEYAHSAEIPLTADDVKAIRAVVESAEVVEASNPLGMMPPGDCIPLQEWKGEI